MSKLAVLPTETSAHARASELAKTLELPLLEAGTEASQYPEFEALLTVADAAVSLQKTGKRAPGPVSVDFGSPEMRHRRRGGANEMLGRAVGVGKKPLLGVIDATAGLGRDAFVLADLGCMVTLWERHPVVAQLLSAGFDRAVLSDDYWLQEVVSRMKLNCGDVCESSVAEDSADVIYMDPMFPARQKQAAVKKEMALLQWLLQDTRPGNDARCLLDWALRQPVSRVVVKRPARSRSVGDVSPSHSIAGKAVRYDVYVRHGIARTDTKDDR